MNNNLLRNSFSSQRSLVELYNALHGTDYGPETEVTNCTIANDNISAIAFVIDGGLAVIAEETDEISLNLPLRLMLYTARVYNVIVGQGLEYRQKVVKLPRPAITVLYSGSEPASDTIMLRLSDAFEYVYDKRDSAEFEITVLNVNAGHNTELLARSDTLREYAAAVARA